MGILDSIKHERHPSRVCQRAGRHPVLPKSSGRVHTDPAKDPGAGERLRDHTLVAKALKDMDESRRCYRLVGQVMVERTVGQVLPAVNHQKSGIADIIEKLGQKLEVQGALIQAIQAKYKIRLRGQNDGAGPSSAAASSSSDNKHHGVLA